MRFHFTSILILVFAVQLSSQEARDTSIQNTQLSNNDDEYGLFDMFSGNPGKAAMYSLIFPGAGQFYNKKYWKVPIALAAEGIAVYMLIDNIKDFRKWDDEWEFQLVNQTNNPDVTSVYDPDAIKRIRDNARQRKDYSWVALVGVHLIITAEAFINRHLIEFDVSDDLSLQIKPANYAPGASFVLNF